MTLQSFNVRVIYQINTLDHSILSFFYHLRFVCSIYCRGLVKCLAELVIGKSLVKLPPKK